MAKKHTFPITIKAGSTLLRIYRNPLRIRRVTAGGVLENDRKEYDSYVVSYYRGGKRQRTRFKSLDSAKTEADRIRTLILNEDLVALQLTGRDRVIYARANETAGRLGFALDAIAAEFAEAKEFLGEVSIVEAARFFDRYGRTVKQFKTVPEIVAELVEGLKADKLSNYHIRDVESRLGLFAGAFKGRILEVRTKAIVDWLRGLKWKDNEEVEHPFAAKTRNHYRNAVVQLFNFARDHGYLPKGLPTEAESVKTLNVIAPENEIFTVDDLTTLLKDAPKHLIAPISLKAFSGIRTEELLRLNWEHINWGSKHIVLPSDVTKTSQRRLVPIQENLFAWLFPFKEEAGRICDRWETPQTLVQAFDRYGKTKKIEVGANRFRNSYISYRVAVTQDVQRVALESGNSPRVIQREYLELATEADGKRWFAVFPKLSKAP
jgi:integrase